MIEWFRKYVAEFAIDPRKDSTINRTYVGKYWSAVSDIDVVSGDQNVSEWIRENCKHATRIDYVNMDKTQLLHETYDRFGIKFQKRGVFIVKFTNKVEASMFRLTFSELFVPLH